MSRELRTEVLEKFLKHIDEGLENHGYYICGMGGNLTVWRKDFANKSCVFISDGAGETHEFNRDIIISLHKNEDDCDPLCWEVQLDQEGKVLWTW